MHSPITWVSVTSAQICVLPVSLVAFVVGVTMPCHADEGGQLKKGVETQVAVRSVETASVSTPIKPTEKLSEGIDLSQLDSPEWKHALEQLAKRPGVQSGQVQLSVLRVILKEDQASEVQAAQRETPQRAVNGVRLFIVGGTQAPQSPSASLLSQKENLIHATGGKLISLDPQDAGGIYKQLKSGDFVVLDHVNSTRRKDGRDPLQIGSWTHRHAELWIPVPPRGELGVVGDLVLERVSQEELGGVIVELDTSAVPGDSFKSMHFGPLFTGGVYGRKYQATETGIAGTNRIAPGTYFLSMPGIRQERGHWPVSIKPGETVYLRFRWNKERVLELVEQHSMIPHARSE